MTGVVGYVPDLMDRSRIAATGADVTFVASPADLAVAAAEAALVVVDLSRPGVLEVVGGLGPAVVGFAPHVDADLLAAARAAGCRTVLARSAFFARLGALLAGADDRER
jgi:hypothetical protein